MKHKIYGNFEETVFESMNWERLSSLEYEWAYIGEPSGMYLCEKSRNRG